MAVCLSKNIQSEEETRMQFGLDEILTVIDKVKHTGLSAFEYEDADTRIKIKAESKACAAVLTEGLPSQTETVVAVPEKAADNASAIKTQERPEDDGQSAMILSPMVGTFYAAPSEDARPFVSVGDTVKKGQVVGIIEAMKLMNEIEAECDGIVSEILIQNEQMVEYGQQLMKVKIENA